MIYNKSKIFLEPQKSADPKLYEKLKDKAKLLLISLIPLVNNLYAIREFNTKHSAVMTNS